MAGMQFDQASEERKWILTEERAYYNGNFLTYYKQSMLKIVILCFCRM